jgi:hypothetical protein
MLVNIGLEHKILSYIREGYIINVGEYWPEHKIQSYTREGYIINVGEYWPQYSTGPLLQLVSKCKVVLSCSYMSISFLIKCTIKRINTQILINFVLVSIVSAQTNN